MFSLGGANLCAFELVDLAPNRIWADEWYERQRRLMAAADHLNGKYGRGAVKCGLFHSDGLWPASFLKTHRIRITFSNRHICLWFWDRRRLVVGDLPKEHGSEPDHLRIRCERVPLRRRVGVAVQRRRAFNYLARRSVSNCCVGSSMMLWYGVGDPPSARLVALPTPDVADSTGGACRFISFLARGL